VGGATGRVEEPTKGRSEAIRGTIVGDVRKREGERVQGAKKAQPGNKVEETEGIKKRGDSVFGVLSYRTAGDNIENFQGTLSR